MTGTNVARFTHKSVPVIFEPPCMYCMLLYVFDMFHILLSGDSLKDLWNIYVHVRACVCVCVGMCR